MKRGERRQSQRTEIVLPVEHEKGRGWTRNVSGTGAYFVSEQRFAAGAHIKFILPLRHADPERVVRVTYEGDVVRVDERAGRFGVAVAITSYRMKDDDSGIPN